MPDTKDKRKSKNIDSEYHNDQKDSENTDKDKLLKREKSTETLTKVVSKKKEEETGHQQDTTRNDESDSAITRKIKNADKKSEEVKRQSLKTELSTVEDGLLDSSTDGKTKQQVEEDAVEKIVVKKSAGKKRGRPRKSHTATEDTPEMSPVAVEACPMEESRSGRKRKKVNYFELEFSKVDTKREKRKTTSESSFQDDAITPKKTPRVNARKSKRESTSNEHHQKNDVTPSLGESKELAVNDLSEASAAAENVDGDISIVPKEDCGDDRTGGDVDRKTGTSKGHYKLARPTTQMVNSVFSAALQNINTHQDRTGTRGLTHAPTASAVNVPLQPRDKCADGDQEVTTCAICNKQMDRKSWSNHKQKIHNNLAWRIGDTPLDLNDQDFVLSVLNALYKAKKPLYCDKCGMKKKSALGYLSHRSQCGIGLEEAQVECSLCGKKLLPVSMPSHIKLVHETPKQMPAQSSSYFDTDQSVTSNKRKAAQKAMLIIDKMTNKGDQSKEQMQPYATPTDFKEAEFMRPILERELKKCDLVKCKFEDCQFSSVEIDSLLDHMNSCTCKPADEFHVCTTCLLIYPSEEDMKSHVTVVHDVFLPDEEDTEESFTSGEEEEDDEAEKVSVKRKKKKDSLMLQKVGNYKVKPLCIYNIIKEAKTLFPSAFDFTWDFCTQHYDQPMLFNSLRYSNFEWELVHEDRLGNYLPATVKSCEVARKSVRALENVLGQETTFRRYELFETDHEDVHTTIFCGGPINALAWAPTPYTSLNSEQILAVAAGGDFDAKYKVNTNYKEPAVIQFWSMGVIANKGARPQPNLLLLLSVDYGPIWHLEWCPSGCYDEPVSELQVRRMGLLAVAGCVSEVYIYSVAFLEPELRGLMYEAKPMVKLQLLIDSGNSRRNFFPTKMSWSKYSGHKHVAVGYSDGTVAVYDLQTTSKLLRCQNKDATEVLLPCKVIQAHKHSISVLSMVPLKGGAKWLLTGSFDKCIHWWDLDNNDKITVNRKKILTDGAWLTNWMAYVVTTNGSSSTNNLTSACVNSHRNYLYDQTFVTHSQATLTSISSSDWLNGLVQSSSVGEVMAVFPHQMLYALDTVKRTYKYLFSYAKLIDKWRSPQERVADDRSKTRILKNLQQTKNSATQQTNYTFFEPVVYEQAERQYGLLFCDLKMDRMEDFKDDIQSKLSSRECALEISKPNLYPLQAANKVCFNPNRQASLYLATGYQAGFVRVSYMKFLEDDLQIEIAMKS